MSQRTQGKNHTQEETFLQELARHVRESRKIASLQGMEALEKASIKEIVDGLVEYAYKSTASDIHIDPIEGGTIIRYRIDGILHDVLLLSSEVHFKVVTRIKVLSELRTDEHYAPQDGRFRMILNTIPVDMRVSISPTFFGENTVIRLLVGQTSSLALEELGFSQKDLKRIQDSIQKSYGMVIATGPTGSGKTTVVKKIIEGLPKESVAVLSQDSYYKDNSHLPLEERLELNFDHPDSVDFKLLVKHVKELKAGRPINQPIYSYLTCSRSETETIPVNPTQVIIIEGILIFTCPDLRKCMDIMVFVDADADDRLGRVITRDNIERGRTIEKVLERYDKTVKPMHLQFIEPSKRYADIIIPQGGHNLVAIGILLATIEKSLHKQ